MQALHHGPRTARGSAPRTRVSPSSKPAPTRGFSSPAPWLPRPRPAGRRRPRRVVDDRDREGLLTKRVVALLSDWDRHLVAKFSFTTDTRPVVKAEAVATLLASRAGLNVAPVEVRRVDGRDVLLVERFDRLASPEGPTRRLMLSMLTVLGYTAMSSRHASYAEMAAAIRTGPWSDVPGTLRELYKRLVRNVIVGNNDDHLRNHAAFWDGEQLTLTPAYDVAPQSRNDQTSTQAIGITRNDTRWSQLSMCRKVARDFLISPTEAKAISEELVDLVRSDWVEVGEQACLWELERADLWQREILNPFIFRSDDPDVA